MTNNEQQPRDLTYINDFTYRGYGLFTKYCPFVKEYLDINEVVLDKALLEHPRTMAARLDLRIPYGAKNDSEVISCFSGVLNELVKSDLKRRSKKSKRRHHSSLRYVWAREKDNAPNFHYHIVIFLNGDHYRSLGQYSPEGDGLYGYVCTAWARALELSVGDVGRLVHVPDNAVYRVDKNSESYLEQRKDVLARLGYMAKYQTKVYGDFKKSYGSSRK